MQRLLFFMLGVAFVATALWLPELARWLCGVAGVAFIATVFFD